MANLIVACAIVLLSAAACFAKPTDCPFVCPMLFAPVCASDGVTYSNACMMRGAACRLGKELQTVSAGPCKKDAPSEALAVSRRQINCPQVCAAVYKPVCGSDGKTYGNECELAAAACIRGGLSLKAVSYGECQPASSTSAPAAPKDCNTMCTMQYDPVCASDGNTYGNECMLNSTACELDKPLKLVSKGECPAKDVVSKNPETKCLGICPMIYLPVCGSDGKSYGNDCEMKHEACITEKTITVAHMGICVEKPKLCQTMCIALYAPVCGSDGQTYSNECVMKASACQKGITLTVSSQGECPLATDKCQVRPCPKIYDPVCGSDKKIYANQCLFSNAQCEQQIQGKKLEQASDVYCELGN